MKYLAHCKLSNTVSVYVPYESQFTIKNKRNMEAAKVAIEKSFPGKNGKIIGRLPDPADQVIDKNEPLEID